MIRPTKEIQYGALGLALAVALIYFPVVGFDFISVGDPEALFDNPLVRAGFSLQDLPGILTVEAGVPLQPLPRMVHAVMVHAFGDRAGAYHLANLLLHLLNALLFFLILERSTKKALPSFLAAMIFSTMPLHVEVVAWIAQLRILLCTLFCLLAIFFHSIREKRHASLLVAIFHFLAILCGPEAVMLLVMLLIMDYWPLRRTSHIGARQLLMEKWPSIILSFLALLLILAPYTGPDKLVTHGFLTCLNNILSHFSRYLTNTFWPQRMGLFHYELFSSFLLWVYVLFFAALITLAGWMKYRETPIVIAWWLWYFLNLVFAPLWFHNPGGTTMADSHTYIPSLGLAWMFAWIPYYHYVEKKGLRKQAFTLMVAMLLLLYGLCSISQVQTWKNSRTVFHHSLRAMGYSPQALTGLGVWLYNNHSPGLAEGRYEAALECDPQYTPAHYHLGNALAARGDLEKAEHHLSLAVMYQSNHARALNQLGNLMLKTGRPQKAIFYLRSSIHAAPDLVIPRVNLASALAASGQLNLAEKQYKSALELNPHMGRANLGLASVLVKMGRLNEAVAPLEENLSMGMEEADSHFLLGDIALRQGNPTDAVPHFRMALAAKPDFPQALNNLGAALLMRGQAKGAIENFNKALELDPDYTKARKNLEHTKSVLRDRAILP